MLVITWLYLVYPEKFELRTWRMAEDQPLEASTRMHVLVSYA